MSIKKQTFLLQICMRMHIDYKKVIGCTHNISKLKKKTVVHVWKSNFSLTEHHT